MSIAASSCQASTVLSRAGSRGLAFSKRTSASRRCTVSFLSGGLDQSKIRDWTSANREGPLADRRGVSVSSSGVSGPTRRLSSAVAMWGRPPVQKETPGPGQESVWDYPRPPRVEKTPKHIKVDFNGVTIVDTKNAYRVLETSHPPTYYLPQEDLKMEYFKRSPGQRSFCEWKGYASYWTIKVGDKEARDVAWSYENPTAGFAPIKGYIAMYAAPMDGVYVDGEKASPQAGGMYGGWITKDIVGPMKGIPGSMGW